ncbi:MAG TPA: endonuclease/exonuclease/phosphatase family protein [Gemmatimonadaceae bacterium]|nr:endonuclease/exonuclease/phosphatase family protein [Gemmatimonadaceae bacterium]
MTRRPAALLLALALCACADPAAMTAPRTASQATVVRADRLPAGGARALTVMTRNLYLGGDIFGVAAPSPTPIPVRVAQFWQTVLASNFPERAGTIAQEIGDASPELIGLQEVPIYRIDPLGDAAVGGTHPATVVALDFLATLQDSLAARGLCYRVASSDLLSDLEFPMVASVSPLRIVDLRYTDRDVILARCDVPTSDPRSGVYSARLTVSVSGIPVSVLRGWASTLATWGGVTYRFVTTHLETDGAPTVQVAQARELVAVLAGETHPVVLVGDFNSAADGSQTATYGILLSEGNFVDAWTEAHPRDPGYTSSLPASLFGPPQLTTRIDLVLVRYGFVASPRAGIVGGVHADVIGEELADRTPTGRWPSDHAGVVVTLNAPKAIGKK